MAGLDAVAKILSEAGVPLGYREITRRILAASLWKSSGLTPEATINAQLSVDILNRGTASQFQRTEKGVFALREWNLPEYKGRSARNGGGPTQSPTIRPPVAPKLSTQQETPSEPESLSFTDATEQVLELYGNHKPMHYREITQHALNLGLIETAARTPEATLYASVLQEIDRQTRRGETPRFVKLGRGHLGLAQWQHQGLAAQIERHNANVRSHLLARLKSMHPVEFETLIGQLLAAIGFDEVEVTSSSGDGGIDVRGTLVVGDVIRTRMAVQVKRWGNNIHSPTVQQVRGALGTHEQGLIITTSDFSSGARTEAERPNAVPVALMNGDQLVALLVEHSIGVQRAAYDLLELSHAQEE